MPCGAIPASIIYGVAKQLDGQRVGSERGRMSEALSQFDRNWFVLLKVFPYKRLNRWEMSVGEILKAAPAICEGFLNGAKRLDHRDEMTIVVHEFNFDGSEMSGVAGDRDGG